MRREFRWERATRVCVRNAIATQNAMLFTLFHIEKRAKERAKGGRRTNEIKFWEQEKYVRIGELRETTMWMSKRDNKLKSNCCARNSRRWLRMFVASRIAIAVWLAQAKTDSGSEHSQIIFNFSINFYLTFVSFQYFLEHLFDAASVSLQCSYEPCSLFDFC